MQQYKVWQSQEHQDSSIQFYEDSTDSSSYSSPSDDSKGKWHQLSKTCHN